MVLLWMKQSNLTSTAYSYMIMYIRPGHTRIQLHIPNTIAWYVYQILLVQSVAFTFAFALLTIQCDAITRTSISTLSGYSIILFGIIVATVKTCIK